MSSDYPNDNIHVPDHPFIYLLYPGTYGCICEDKYRTQVKVQKLIRLYLRVIRKEADLSS